MSSSREYPSPQQKGLELPGNGGGVGKFCNTKQHKKCMKLNWNFQMAGGVGGGGE